MATSKKQSLPENGKHKALFLVFKKSINEKLLKAKCVTRARTTVVKIVSGHRCIAAAYRRGEMKRARLWWGK